MYFREILSKMWVNIQLTLFPDLEDRIGPLTKDHKNVVSVLELIRIEDFVPSQYWRLGRPIKDRCKIARAFVAKIVLKIPSNKELVQRLKMDKQLKVICGWEYYSKIPSESSFSRVFKEFAEIKLAEKVHSSLVSEVFKDKIIGHLTIDSTPINAREKCEKRKESSKERKKIVNKKLAKERKEGTGRKQKQLKQELNEMIADLPTKCDVGAKKGTYGYKLVWKGYKLHVSIDDHCIPIAAIVTSASLNDCEVAIPLAKKSKQLVNSFYYLMDSAYDVKEIKQYSGSLGHVAIIDSHSRSKTQKAEKEAERERRKLLNFYPAERRRYKERFSKERFNALFKDYYGGRNIYYKGALKVSSHIMFGILALTATTLLSFIQ
jgi:hypothetical protein